MSAQHAECQCEQMAVLVADLSARLDAIQPVIVAAFEVEGRHGDIPAAIRPPAASRPSLICLPGGTA